MKIRIPQRIDKTVLLLFMMLLYPAIGGYLRAIVTIFFPIKMSTFDTIIWFIVIIWTLPFFIGKLKLKHFCIYGSFVLFAVLQWLLCNHEVFKLDTLGTIAFSVLPAFFIGASIDLEKNSFDSLYKLSIFVLLVSIAYSFYYLSDRTLLSDNMDFAYKVLPAVMIITSGIFIKGKKTDSVIFTVIAIVFLLALGTRGPILCFIVFVLLLLIKNIGLTKFTITAAVLGITINIFINSPLYTRSLVRVSNILEDAGFSTRVVEMLLENKVADANGRDAIQDKLLNEIREEPFAFRGIFSDRSSTVGLVDREYFTSYENGTYAHNLFIEIFHNYGVFLGSLLLIILSVIIYKLLKGCRKEAFYIVALCFCAGVVHLLLSGSYLTEPYFFMMIGLFFNNILQRKNFNVEAVLGTDNRF